MMTSDSVTVCYRMSFGDAVTKSKLHETGSSVQMAMDDAQALPVTVLPQIPRMTSYMMRHAILSGYNRWPITCRVLPCRICGNTVTSVNPEAAS
jgi:hypothetical protein